MFRFGLIKNDKKMENLEKTVGNKLNRIKDLTKALELLKEISEKYDVDFTVYISCHSICDHATISLHVGGYDSVTRTNIDYRLELNSELGDNLTVLTALADIKNHGPEKHPDLVLAKAKQDAENRETYMRLKAEFEGSEVNNG